MCRAVGAHVALKDDAGLAPHFCSLVTQVVGSGPSRVSKNSGSAQKQMPTDQWAFLFVAGHCDRCMRSFCAGDGIPRIPSLHFPYQTFGLQMSSMLANCAGVSADLGGLYLQISGGGDTSRISRLVRAAIAGVCGRATPRKREGGLCAYRAGVPAQKGWPVVLASSGARILAGAVRAH